MKLFQWFYNNKIKANIDKCHFLANLHINAKITTENFVIQNSDSQKLLGATIDGNFNFIEHVSNLCKIQA